MKIEIRRIPRERWHKQTGKNDFSRPFTIRALLNVDEMRYNTGLNEKDIKYLKEEKGFRFDLSDTFNREKPHPFWDSSMATLALKASPVFLETTKPLDFVKYKIATASKYVANSWEEYEEGLFPEATHYIRSEEEEATKKAKKWEIIEKAVELSKKLSKKDKVNIITILEGKILKGKSDNVVEGIYSDLLQSKPKDVVELLEGEKEYTELKANVLEALQKGVLTKKNLNIMYFDIPLGTSIDDVVDELSKPDNQEISMRIIAAIND